MTPVSAWHPAGSRNVRVGWLQEVRDMTIMRHAACSVLVSRLPECPMTNKLSFAVSTIVVVTGLAACSACKSDRPESHSVAQQAQPAKKDPAAARAAMAAGSVVLDVRTSEEFAEEHLSTAVNVPVDDLGTRLAEVDKLVAGDKSRTIVVYCAAGSRAGKARGVLESAGYTHVINGGGLDDLR